MEIHLPGPVASLKEFFRELLTMTAGILIALSLEALIQWHHHRELAQEAKANIISELRANQRELTGQEQRLSSMQQDVQAITNLVHQLEEKKLYTGQSGTGISPSCIRPVGTPLAAPVQSPICPTGR